MLLPVGYLKLTMEGDGGSGVGSNGRAHFLSGYEQPSALLTETVLRDEDVLLSSVLATTHHFPESTGHPELHRCLACALR